MPPNSKETKLGSSNQEASPSVGKNTGIVLVPCNAWKIVPKSISSGVDISENPSCHLLWHEFSMRVTKLLQGLVSHELAAYLSVFNLFLTQWIMAILSKGCKPDNFEPDNSLKLSFTNIWRLYFNFVECESFLESNLLTILLCVRQTWMTQLILAISLWGVIHMQSYSLFERRTSFCTGSLEDSVDSYLRFQLALLHSVSYFFFLYPWPSLWLCMVFWFCFI